MDLEKIRSRIDRIDYEILKNLHERMELILRTRRYKKEIRDEKREVQLYAQLKEFSRPRNLLHPEFIDKVYREILTESRNLQKKPYRLIGFQGEHGAFGEVAAGIFDQELVPIPCFEFSDVFADVDKGGLDYGIVPIQNSLGGPISQVNELLIQSDLKVVGAVKLHINHCLLTLADTDYREIREVYSHPQALSQCRNFIQRQRLEPKAYYDTAGAARMLAAERPGNAGVIASSLCSGLYDLHLIKENIEDHADNFTRFLVLSRDGKSDGADRCSLVFSTRHEAGALYAVLQIFAEAGINLTRIESFLYRDDPGHYVFFLDFQIGSLNGKLDSLLKQVKKITPMYKFLGKYSEKEADRTHPS